MSSGSEFEEFARDCEAGPDLTPEAKAFTSLAGETQVGRARADLG
jgi:hypothetical protein